MKKISAVALCAVIAVSVLLLEPPQLMVEAVNCSPLELSPCLGAITSNTPPSQTCCQKLREQKTCLCGYLKNPSLRQYVNSPGAKRVATKCQVAIPNC
ncbi:hypothetical protein L6164_006464 [Bauhinia variegata]|uniref:Uncharacterized protein n=1 Tax=Bauhinia variegata TaxID=167791 RepID=A0ACB9PZZ0_BAUVA|nr:hypothetical protein L6164_006464 [Bauhinia variegata]